MTIQHMKYILEIAKHHSFSGAAKALFLSQSALSATVKDMETDLGIFIFERNNKGVVLTEDGRDFLRRIQPIVDQVEALEDYYSQPLYPPMRFSVSSQRLSFATRAFNRLLRVLSEDSYDIAMRECPTNTVIQDVSTGKSALGVLAIEPEKMYAMQRTLAAEGLCFTELARMKTYVFLRRTHPLADRAALSIEDLAEYPFVTYDQGPNAPHFMEEDAIYQRLKRNVYVNDRSTKIALIRNNDCFSIGPDLPNSNASAMRQQMPEIYAKTLKERPEPLYVGYLVRKGAQLDSIAQLYRTLLEQEIRRLQETLSEGP